MLRRTQRTHTHTTTTTQQDDLSSCMATGVVRKHRHSVRTPATEGTAQAWDRATSMVDTCARKGSSRAGGAKSADWGTAR